MNLHKYDDLLSFDLPDDFHIINEVNDEGQPVFGIGIGKTVDDEGEDNYEYRLNISSQDESELGFDSSKLHLKGSVKNNVQFVRKSQSLLGMEFVFTVAFIFLIHEEKTYVLSSVLVGEGERQENWLSFVNKILSGVILEGQKGDFEIITEDMLNESFKQENSDEIIEKMPYPVATPDADQCSHWNYLEGTKRGMGFLGGMVSINQSGTEYSFEELDKYFWENFCDKKTIDDIVQAAKGFDLAETAREMGEIFRVSEEAFEEGEDREQEIDSGLLRRCGMYEAFRSFAWTLAAYCDEKGVLPEQVSIFEIEEIADFVIEQRGRLNYQADSFCPVLCSGDDIHNYYISDATPESARKMLELSIRNEYEDEQVDPQTRIMSLEGLRKEMEYLFPVMQTIYDNLAIDRDFNEPLEGAVAEVLYVWCSMTYALRSPIYIEDGPMTCMWMHPGTIPTLKSFGKADNQSEKEVDCGYSFTYEQGITFENEHYSFRLPDGFVVKENEEDRDFVAYLPNESDPDEYSESDFIIYAGQELDGKANSQLKLPLTYHALLRAFESEFPDAFSWLYYRRELPGNIVVSPDSSCLHANAIVAYGETIKMFRFQVTVSGKRQLRACENLIKSMLDQITPKHPVEILDDIDAAEYVDMTEDGFAKWTELLNEHSAQVAIARNLRQEQLAKSIQSGNFGRNKVIKMLREMLRDYTGAAAKFLKKADAVYQLKRNQYPDNEVTDKMKSAIDGAFMNLVHQFINLDEERIECVDDYKAIYERHSVIDAEQAIDEILESCTDVLSDAVIAALKKIKNS